MSDLPDGSDVNERAADHDYPFVLIDEVRPPPRIQLSARAIADVPALCRAYP